MDKRLGRLLLAVGVLIVLMVAPLLYLQSQLNGGGVDPNYRALKIYARSLEGDASSDTEASKIYPSLTVKREDKHDVYYRGDTNNCWKLDPAIDYEPVKTKGESCK